MAHSIPSLWNVVKVLHSTFTKNKLIIVTNNGYWVLIKVDVVITFCVLKYCLGLTVQFVQPLNIEFTIMVYFCDFHYWALKRTQSEGTRSFAVI